MFARFFKKDQEKKIKSFQKLLLPWDILYQKVYRGTNFQKLKSKEFSRSILNV